MTKLRKLAAVGALAICAPAAAGCGIGPGGGRGTAELRATRDYGNATVVGPRAEKVGSSETVLRMLDRSAKITTSYGGKFVQSLNGIAGKTAAGRRYDWFFYVNGVESPVGSADVVPRAGDRVWWDYRDWTSAIGVPAVVGSFPEPFLHGVEGRKIQTRIDCLGTPAPCRTVQSQLRSQGVDAGVFDTQLAPGSDAAAARTLRIIVGPWSRVGSDRAAALIQRGPGASGVFARFEGSGPGAALDALNQRAQVAQRPGPGAGLIAAVRESGVPPTWIVTGTTAAGVAAAAGAVDVQDLRNRYAVVAQASHKQLALPVIAK